MMGTGISQGICEGTTGEDEPLCGTVLITLGVARESVASNIDSMGY